MSLNPLNELKRRLEDDSIPLAKRFCLAKNVVQSHHFPSAPKERVVSDWLASLSKANKLSGDELTNVISWLNTTDDFTSDLKNKLIQVVSQYLQRNPLQDNNLQCFLSFLDNSKIHTQLTLQIDECLNITTTLLQYLENNESNDNIVVCDKILNNIVNYYRECKRKQEFIVKLLDGENIETIFSFLGTGCHNTVINLCRNVLFSMNKKSFFVSFLQTLIRKDNIDELMAEKGDNIQSVLKIMSTFFTFPKGRTEKDWKYLANFIEVFVSCFKAESQLIFAFYIMVVDSLNMSQSYINPAMKMPPIIFENDEKVKRNLFLKMLEVLLQNEVDITVKLTDTFGEKISKVEIKKNFTSFLQNVLLGQLKLEGKLDKTTLEIVKVAMKLDPVLIEQKMDKILPPLMAAKKHSISILESYTDMMNCLLGILFKLSRGTLFINQILPHIKLCLESVNNEQFELKQKIKEATENGTDCEKYKSKLITGKDVFPEDTLVMYGKCTSELLFRQNKEVLKSLQKDIEDHCLMMLEEGFVSPSIITLAQVLSAILSSFLRHNKMADHTVPMQVAVHFWAAYQRFEGECLKKYGECVLKLNYDPTLATAFLRLCESCAQLRLLNVKYSNTKVEVSSITTDVLDLSAILPFLDATQWTEISEKIDGEAKVIFDNLLLIKTMAINLLSDKEIDNTMKTEALSSIKTHIIKQVASNPDILTSNKHFPKVLFANLNQNQLKQCAKVLVKIFLNNPELDLITNDAVTSDKLLINSIVTEIGKNISKCLDGVDNLSKCLNKSDFHFVSFIRYLDVEQYFNQISIKDGEEDTVMQCIQLLKSIPIQFAEEPKQLLIVFLLLVAKKNTAKKKSKKAIDHILQTLYELNTKHPDLYKIFPVKFIFNFEEKLLLNLLTLKMKTSNDLLVIKKILESTVKKVKTEADILKEVVEILLAKQTIKKVDVSSIEYFSDTVFQISCIILPILTKERRSNTTSAYRSILANCQERLYISVLECFKNIDFSGNTSLLMDTSGNIDESAVVSENTLAIVNAMGAYSLTLSKYCGTTEADGVKNLGYLCSALEFFVQNAIQSIQNPNSKQQYVESSVQLIHIVLRNAKKLETHPIFQEKDKLCLQIWKSIVSRLLIVYERDDAKRGGGDSCLEEISLSLKILCGLVSVECFGKEYVGDLAKLAELKKPSELKSQDSPRTVTSHRAAKYLWSQCLKAYIVGPKCGALTYLLYDTTKTLRTWIYTHFDCNQDGVLKKRKNLRKAEETERGEIEETVPKADDEVCDLLAVDLETITEAVLSGKQVTINSQCMNAIFTLLCAVDRVDPGHAAVASARAATLNALLMARQEVLEDRWPSYMQCYRALVRSLCARAVEPGRDLQTEKMAELAHSIEKLTQSICRRKTHVSRIAAYAVADICNLIETKTPPRPIRQHLENAVAMLIQASDTTHAMAFLRRALVNSPGQMTMTNLYTMYKRYHKYVGNA